MIFAQNFASAKIIRMLHEPARSFIDECGLPD
jgi:hypothetical protein